MRKSGCRVCSRLFYLRGQCPNQSRTHTWSRPSILGGCWGDTLGSCSVHRGTFALQPSCRVVSWSYSITLALPVVLLTYTFRTDLLFLAGIFLILRPKRKPRAPCHHPPPKRV